MELDADQFFKAMESVLGGISHEGAAGDADFEGASSSSDMEFGIFLHCPSNAQLCFFSFYFLYVFISWHFFSWAEF